MALSDSPIDCLFTPETSPRGRDIVRAIYSGAIAQSLDARLITCGSLRERSVLVLYGLGGRDRMGLAMQHLAHGGRIVSVDAGYWQRKLSLSQRKYRISIDGFHSPKLVMRGQSPGAERWLESGLTIVQSGNPNGPIMLVGNGPKSNMIGASGWAQQKSIELRKMFPDRHIAYRPKPKRPHDPDVIYDSVSTGIIDEALADISLVVCRHSNVAVDACRLGIPVVCQDGAAASIYPSALHAFMAQPSPELREEFLHRLAFWQWSIIECARGSVWPWLLGMLNAKSG